MRFIHTADWHLGRAIKGISLIEDQAHILNQIVALAGETRPDLVVVAGDVYDRAVPSAEAVSLLDDTLVRLVKGLGIPVLLIAGNHDSAERVGYGGRIFRDENLFVFGPLSAAPEPVVLRDEHGEVRFFGVPYAGPLAAREALGIAEIADHEAVLRECSARCAAKVPAGARAVLVAHAFVSGGEVCESERGLAVGGTGEVSAGALAGFHYVALGHLHRSQAVDGGRIHYSGSPLKYSASEAEHRKSVKLVAMGGDGACRVEEMAIKPLRDLRRIRGKLDELVQAGLADTGRNDIVFAELTDEGPPLNPMQRLQDVYPNAVEVVRAGQDGDAGVLSDIPDEDEQGQLPTLELFAKFFQYAVDAELSREQARAFEGVLAGMMDKGEDD